MFKCSKVLDRMATQQLLLGLDFGTTTSHCVIAQTQLEKNWVLGRREFSGSQVRYQSAPVFTPRKGNRLDLLALEQLVQKWRQESGLDWKHLVGGGALLTGLAAQSENAPGLLELIRQEAQEILTIQAEDPLLESWVACLANCQGLMQQSPQKMFLNFDIGGGTTNTGLCQAGRMLATDWKMIGARHFVLEPGSYRITAITPPGVHLLRKLGIRRRVGAEFSRPEVDRIVQHFTRQLEIYARRYPRALRVFSGGVGELLYQPRSDITPYGDFGVELAEAIRASRVLGRDLDRYVPDSRGRATVLGMALYSTQVSGDSVFLEDTRLLPLQAPVRGTLRNGAIGEPGAYFLATQLQNVAALKRLAPQVAKRLDRNGTPRPYVFILNANLGKLFGTWLRLYSRKKSAFIVLDEIETRPAHYLALGKVVHQNVPVSLYGFEK
ncbi:ethanolamine ammonia-lyase reactivating factor EutA [bacterium]|nr:ethanolamine ammonia-lyase reactivating factor EutA [bacterium]